MWFSAYTFSNSNIHMFADMPMCTLHEHTHTLVHTIKVHFKMKLFQHLQSRNCEWLKTLKNLFWALSWYHYMEHSVLEWCKCKSSHWTSSHSFAMSSYFFLHSHLPQIDYIKLLRFWFKYLIIECSFFVVRASINFWTQKTCKLSCTHKFKLYLFHCKYN